MGENRLEALKKRLARIEAAIDECMAMRSRCEVKANDHPTIYSHTPDERDGTARRIIRETYGDRVTEKDIEEQRKRRAAGISVAFRAALWE